MRVGVLRAWPEGHECVELQLPEGATVADALQASGLPCDGMAGFAVFGVRADASTRLHDGDRVELLRPLLVDPKQARRRRAEAQKTRD
jgi:putative ubiquitin-RnfH superfamily antitoxin RatB of RatAB toxin-antitoxin module